MRIKKPKFKSLKTIIMFHNNAMNENCNGHYVEFLRIAVVGVWNFNKTSWYKNMVNTVQIWSDKRKCSRE